MEQTYELKLARREYVTWRGSSPEDAARRYVDTHPSETVVATRAAERRGVFVLGGGKVTP